MKNFFGTLIFFITLLPISIGDSLGVGISSNYLFIVLIPLLMNYRFIYNKDGIINLFYFFSSFAIGLTINIFYFNFGFSSIQRQFLSFVAALLPLIFLFFDFSKQRDNFEKAVIICSSIYSFFVFYYLIIFFDVIANNPFYAKEILSEHLPDWPQRYILVIFAGFFFALFKWNRSLTNKLLAMSFLIIIILSYLRAAYLAIFISLIVYLFFILKDLRYDLSYSKFLPKIIIFLVPFSIFIFLVFGDSISLIYDYFMSTIYSLLGQSPEPASDTTRRDIWSASLEVLKINPLTGNGGGGIYLYDENYGSYHNQFIDILTRWGILGLLIFLFFNYKIIRTSSTSPADIGIIFSFLIFGLAHETIKYSYGAIIFYFILSCTYRRRESNNY